MSSLTVDANKQAYKKAYLHTCKYTQDDVMGALIGKVNGSQYIVTDAYPLFHSKILQVPLEMAFQLIEANLTQGEKIIGLYESKVASDGKLISDLAKEILESINSKDKIDPLYLKIFEVEEEDEVSTKLASKFVTLHDQQKLNEVTPFEYGTLQDNLKQGLHWKIIDFDAHFENVALDFTNKYLND